MIPLENLVIVSQTTTPQVISHYNLFHSTEINGSAAPGFSSGQAIDAMLGQLGMGGRPGKGDSLQVQSRSQASASSTA